MFLGPWFVCQSPKKPYRPTGHQASRKCLRRRTGRLNKPSSIISDTQIHSFTVGPFCFVRQHVLLTAAARVQAPRMAPHRIALRATPPGVQAGESRPVAARRELRTCFVGPPSSKGPLSIPLPNPKTYVGVKEVATVAVPRVARTAKLKVARGAGQGIAEQGAPPIEVGAGKEIGPQPVGPRPRPRPSPVYRMSLWRPEWVIDEAPHISRAIGVA